MGQALKIRAKRRKRKLYLARKKEREINPILTTVSRSAEKKDAVKSAAKKTAPKKTTAKKAPAKKTAEKSETVES